MEGLSPEEKSIPSVYITKVRLGTTFSLVKTLKEEWKYGNG